MRDRTGWMADLAQDLRFVFRLLMKSPAFTLVALATLALGTGANTVMFSVIRSVLLQPLPYPQPDRMVWITEKDVSARNDVSMVIGDDLTEWGGRGTSFDALSVLLTGDATMISGDEAIEVRVACVTEPITRVFGVAPLLGRDFLPDEFVQAPQAPGVRRSPANGSTGVAVLSDRLFRRRFGGDASALGESITFGNISYSIVGVLPAVFRLPVTPSLQLGVGPRTDVDVILNTTVGPGYRGPGAVVGRLKPGIPTSTAFAELSAIRDAVNRARQDGPSDLTLAVSSLHDHVVAGTRPALLVLWGAVAFVLLVALVNIISLLLARSVARSQETAIRVAFGAGRWRLIRQMLAEGVVLAFAGGVAGVALASAVVRALARTTTIDVPRLQDASLNWGVLAFTAALCAVGAVIFGLVPALSVSLRVGDRLKESGRTTSGSRRTRRWHAVLVVCELALALIPLTGAGLMLQSLRQVRAEAAVLRPQQVLAARIQSTTPPQAAKQPDTLRESDELLRDIEGLPGVTAAALWRITFGFPARIAGRPRPDPEIIAMWFNVSPRYHEASGVRLLAGRWFTDRDRTAVPPVVVVSEQFVHKFAGDFSTPSTIVGQTTFGPASAGSKSEDTATTIVGVVTDFRSGRLGILQPDDANAFPQVFFPDARRPLPGGELLVRTGSDPLALVGAIRTVMKSRPHLRLASPRTLDDQLSTAVAPRTFNTLLFVVFAGMALLLAAAGVAGVLWYAVTERTSEIGVRVALGAGSADIVRMVLSYAAALVLAGLAIGLAGSVALSRFVSGLLYGVGPTDLRAYAAVSLLLIAVALGAAYVPAHRAVRLDPMDALRRQ